MRKDEEAGEGHGIDGATDLEPVAEGEVTVGDAGIGACSIVEQEIKGKGGVVEEVLGREEVERVEEAEDGVLGLEGGAAQPHHAEGEGVLGR